MSNVADHAAKAPKPTHSAVPAAPQGGELETPQSDTDTLQHPVATPPPAIRPTNMLHLQRRLGNRAVQQMLDQKKQSVQQRAEGELRSRAGNLLGLQAVLPQQASGDPVSQESEAAPKAEGVVPEAAKADPNPENAGSQESEAAPKPEDAAQQASSAEVIAAPGAKQDAGAAPKDAAASPKSLMGPQVGALTQKLPGAALIGAIVKPQSAAKAAPVVKAVQALAATARPATMAQAASGPAPAPADVAPAQAAAPELPSAAGGEAEGAAPAAAEDPALEEAAALAEQNEVPAADHSAALSSIGESVGGSGGGGGGGGGAAIADKPAPPVPNVASAPPAQAMAALSGLPPMQLHAALEGVSASASNFVDKEQAQLASQPPQMQRPSGAPAQLSTPTTQPEPPSSKGDTKVERAPEGAAKPVAQPKPLPPAPPNPAQKATPPADTKDLLASISNIPTSDPGMSMKAGPAPMVELTGNADPRKTEEQHAKLTASAQKTHAEGKADVAQPMGENDIFPVVPAEILKADISGGPGGGGAAAGKASAAVGAAAGDLDEQGAAVSAIAQEQSGAAIQAAVGKAQGDISSQQQEHNTKITAERAKSTQEIDQLIADNTSAQTSERSKALADVQQQRSQWNQEQTKLVTDAQTEAAQVKAEGLQNIQQEESAANQESVKHIEQGNAEAEAARREGDAEAKREQEQGKSKANSGGFFSMVADQAKGFFDGVKSAIKSVIDKARALVRSALEKAKQLAFAAIERARQAVVTVIRKVGDTLIAIGDRVLAGFPALRDKFRGAIKNAVQKAEQTVNALADKLKNNVKQALDRLGKGIDAALNLLEKGLMAVVNVVKGVVDGAIKAAKAFISALGIFASLIGDIVPNPGQWLSNLGKGATDGVKNHLWNAFQNQVKTWFQTKVEQVLGLGQAVWGLLKKGGITLAQIGGMVWQALQAMIPEILRDLLIEKLVSMIVPAAGAVKLIIEGLQAAWASIGSIMQAVDQFVKFLKAVKTGNAGPAFASALAAAAVAVIDFVSNWLLQRLQNKAVNTVGKKIRALADNIAKGVRTAVRATKQLGSKAGAKLRHLFGGKRVDVDTPRAPKHKLDVDGQNGYNKRADADTDARKQKDKEQDKQRRWNKGLAAIKALPAQSHKKIKSSLSAIKSAFRFDVLKPVDVGNHWQVKAIMRNEATVDVAEEQEQENSATSRGAALANEKGYLNPPDGYHWAEVGGQLICKRNPGKGGYRKYFDPDSNKFKRVRRRKTSNQVKGKIGEKKAHEYMTSRGYVPMKDFKKKYHGIDMIYVKYGPPNEYIIAEAKYGFSKLSKVNGPNGTKIRQMSSEWVRQRLVRAVGRKRAVEVLENHKRWLLTYRPGYPHSRMKELVDD